MRRRARPSPSPLAPSTDDLDGSCGGQGAQAGGRAGPDLGPAHRRYRCVCHLCDDTDTVALMSNMLGEMSGIVIVLS